MPPIPPKQGKFGCYIKGCCFPILPTSHVAYAPILRLYSDLWGDGHVFIDFDPRFSLHISPKQGNFRLYIKICHLRIMPTSHGTYAPKITFTL